MEKRGNNAQRGQKCNLMYSNRDDTNGGGGEEMKMEVSSPELLKTLFSLVLSST